MTADPSQPRDAYFPNQVTAVAAVTARLVALADFEAARAAAEATVTGLCPCGAMLVIAAESAVMAHEPECIASDAEVRRLTAEGRGAE